MTNFDLRNVVMTLVLSSFTNVSSTSITRPIVNSKQSVLAYI